MSVRRTISARPLSAALAACVLLSPLAAVAYWGRPPAVPPALRAIARPVAIGLAVALVGTLSALATSVLRAEPDE